MTDTEPELVVIDPQMIPRFRTNDMAVVQAMTGRGLLAMAGDNDDEAAKFRALAFLTLRRGDPHAPAKDLWERTANVEIEMLTVPPVDPTRNGTGTISLPSPGTGV